MAKERERGVVEGRLAFLDHRAVFEAAPDALLVVDGEGVIREANRQAVKLLGYTQEELSGMPVERVVPEEARDRHAGQRSEYMVNPRARPMGIGMELRALRKDGRQVPVEISLSPCPTPDGTVVIAAVRDVSERKRLRNLGIGTLRAAEEERRRIARELHDDTAQCLAALLVHLRILRRTQDPEAKERLLDEMAEELSSAVEGVRRISRGLRPPALEDVGVEAAIRSHVRSLPIHDRLEVELELEPVDRVTDPDAQLVIYRVVQEAVTNILRHASARRARIALERSEGEVTVRVHDDGKGFDVDAVFLEGSGLGLVGMHERARLVGGRLRILSSPGRGTEVELRLPTRSDASREGTDG
jgi:two-component system, NarL family, sensor histidine kinase UhpB